MKLLLIVMLTLISLIASAQPAVMVLSDDELRAVLKMREEAKRPKDYSSVILFLKDAQLNDNVMKVNPELTARIRKDMDDAFWEKFKKLPRSQQEKYFQQSERRTDNGYTDPPREGAESSSAGSDAAPSPEREKVLKEQKERERIEKAVERLDKMESGEIKHTPGEKAAARAEVIQAQRDYQAEPDPPSTPDQKPNP